MPKTPESQASAVVGCSITQPKVLCLKETDSAEIKASHPAGLTKRTQRGDVWPELILRRPKLSLASPSASSFSLRVKVMVGLSPACPRVCMSSAGWEILQSSLSLSLPVTSHLLETPRVRSLPAMKTACRSGFHPWVHFHKAFPQPQRSGESQDKDQATRIGQALVF